MKWKPYPRYKVSGVEWLGEVPEHWKVKALKHVTSCLDGKRIPLNSEQRALRVGDVPYWGANSIVDYVDEALFDEELVLLGEDGAPFFQPFARVAFHVDEPIWPNNHVHVLRPKEGNGQFLAHYLNCVDFSEFVDGSTRDKLTQGKMKQIPVLLPTEDERSSVGRFLDRETAKIDILIAKQERLIELLQEKRQALISHAVTKGLNRDAAMKPSGVEWLGEVPAHWAVTRLRRVADGGLINGLFKTKDSYGRGAPLVNVFDVYQRDSQIQPETLDRVETTSAELEKYSVVAGDLLFVRSSLKLEGIGVSALVREVFEPTVFECHLVRLRPRRNLVVPRFLSLYLRVAATITSHSGSDIDH